VALCVGHDTNGVALAYELERVAVATAIGLQEPVLLSDGLRRFPTAGTEFAEGIVLADYRADALYQYDSTGRLIRTIEANPTTGALARPRALATSDGKLLVFSVATRSLHEVDQSGALGGSLQLDEPISWMREIDEGRILLGLLPTGEEEETRLAILNRKDSTLQRLLPRRNPAPPGLARAGDTVAADFDPSTHTIYAVTGLDYRISVLSRDGKVRGEFGSPGRMYRAPIYNRQIRNSEEYSAWEATFTPIEYLYVLKDMIAVGYVIAKETVAFDLYTKDGDSIAHNVTMLGRPVFKGRDGVLYAVRSVDAGSKSRFVVQRFVLTSMRSMSLTSILEYVAALVSTTRSWPGPRLVLRLCPGHYDVKSVENVDWAIGELIIRALAPEIGSLSVPSTLHEQLVSMPDDDERDAALREWIRKSPAARRFVERRVVPRLPGVGIRCSDCRNSVGDAVTPASSTCE